MHPRRWIRGLGGLCGGLAAFGVLGVLAVLLSGSVTVVTTNGTSMEPRFHHGDLVVVGSGDYRAGDVVAYRSRDLGSIVLHRVIDREDDTLTLKGDNNSWVDSERPHVSDAVGRELLHVPGAGKAVGALRQPFAASAVVVALGLVSTTSMRRPGLRPSVRRRGSSRPDVAGGSASPWPASPSAPSAAQASAPSARRSAIGHTSWAPLARRVLAPALVATVLAAAVLAFAATRPDLVTTTTDVPYEQSGLLRYEARAPRGPVYETDRILTGDPVFLSLTDTVDVSFDYRVAGRSLRDVTGELRLELEITASNGWSRTIPLGEPARLSGSSATVTAPLELGEVRHLLDRVERATGVRSPSHVLTIVPVATFDASVGGEVVEGELAGRYEMHLDERQLRALGDDVAVRGGVAGVPFEERGTAPVPAKEPGTISAFGRSAPTATVRGVAALAGGLAAALVLAAWAVVRRAGPRSAVDRLVTRHRGRIIRVDGGESGAERTIIEVAGIDELVRLAEHHDRLILHHHEDAGDTFMVDADDTLYRHRIEAVDRDGTRSESGPRGRDGASRC